MDPADYVKRVRAARGALNVSLDTFAGQIGVGRSTLVRIENGTREPKRHEWEAMARVSGLPVEFFLVEDLHAALGGASERPALAERVQVLEDQVGAMLDVLLPASEGEQPSEAQRATVEAARQLFARVLTTGAAAPGRQAG